jgi:Tfp pilus assembly pilus retraction ATPase PilT
MMDVFETENKIDKLLQTVPSSKREMDVRNYVVASLRLSIAQQLCKQAENYVMPYTSEEISASMDVLNEKVKG